MVPPLPPSLDSSPSSLSLSLARFGTLNDWGDGDFESGAFSARFDGAFGSARILIAARAHFPTPLPPRGEPGLDLAIKVAS